MAMFPCSNCGARYNGRQQTMYVHLVEGGIELGGKQRLCPTDFTAAFDWFEDACFLTQLGDTAQELDEPDVASCGLCKSRDVAAAVFGHLYPANALRRSYMGSLCKDCAVRTLGVLNIAP